METLIQNSPANSGEVPRLVRIRCWLRNLRHWKTARAIRDLERAFWTDDGFVLTWKCHIAMTLIDRCGLSHEKANECADELMRALFGCKPNVCVSDGPADARKTTRSAEGPFAARNG